jgi:hypothetical protein
MPVIPALGRLRQEDQKLWASLSYIARTCLRKRKVQSQILAPRKRKQKLGYYYQVEYIVLSR